MGSDNSCRVPATHPFDASDSLRRQAAPSGPSRDWERTTLRTPPRADSRLASTPPSCHVFAAQALDGLRRSPIGHPYAHSTLTKKVRRLLLSNGSRVFFGSATIGSKAKAVKQSARAPDEQLYPCALLLRH